MNTKDKNKAIEQIEKTVYRIEQDTMKLRKDFDDLNAKLSKHIRFIEEVYAPLSTSIDRFKRFFK